MSSGGPAQRPHAGGPLYCRIRTFDGALVEYQTIYHREDGSERIGIRHQLPINGLLEVTRRLV
jgi:hypothetical protein